MLRDARAVKQPLSLVLSQVSLRGLHLIMILVQIDHTHSISRHWLQDGVRVRGFESAMPISCGLACDGEVLVEVDDSLRHYNRCEASGEIVHTLVMDLR